MADELESAADQTEQRNSPPPVAEPAPAVASSAKRQIFENLTHALNDEDVTNRAAVKLIIDRMIRAEEDRDYFKQFERLYYASHERKPQYWRKSCASTGMVEVNFGTGLALAGVAAGAAPMFWDKDHMLPGILCISFAGVLLVMSVLVRIFWDQAVKISLSGIYERGILDKERVHFRADTDIDLSFFVLLDTSWKNSSQVYAGNRSTFWFAPQAIPKGQHVVVYTRAGTPNVEKRTDGSIYHFVFRGLLNPLYAHDDACVVLMEMQTWASTVLKPTPLPPLIPTATGLGLAALPQGRAALGGLFGTGITTTSRNYLEDLNEILKPKS